MHIAATIKQTIEAHAPDAFTLYGGYAVANGRMIRFPVGAQLVERRNDKGRCTFLHMRYADGSELEYRYHEQHGYRLTVREPR